ncbi:MAG: CRISPR-associated protein Cas4 [Pirellulaceae bacterium]
MTEFSDDHLLPISALQHLIFCERQCALIHVERLWVENRLTVEGRHLHDRAHDGPDEHRTNVTIARGLPLRSDSLGLFGVADIVELHHPQHRQSSDSNPRYAAVVPIEYKRGKPKKDDSDRVQLCAQAMCLEEMFRCDIAQGHLFYGKRKRRTEVSLDQRLRQRTRDTTLRLREMIQSRENPLARREPKCDSCSLLELCLPAGTGPNSNAAAFFRRQLSNSLANEDGPQNDVEFDSF